MHRNTTARSTLAATALVALVLVAGCGSSSGGSSSPAPRTSGSASATPSPSPSASASSGSSGSTSSSATITITNYTFKGPASVKPGAMVMVKNMDGEAHTVTADGKGGFDVKVAPHATAMFTAPSAAGTYAYHCTYHADMHGKLVVG